MTPEIIFPNIGIEIEHLSRVAFWIFGLPIYFYGLLIGSAMAICTLYVTQDAKRTGQDPELYTNFIFYAIVTCIVGARAYYVAFQWDYYKDNLLQVFATREGGLAIYGAVLAAIATAAVYTKVFKMNFWLFADTTAPALILGQGIGRWGNFFNKEAFGGYTDSLFAMQYLESSVSSVPEVVARHTVLVNGASYIQVHPTFLYESVLCLSVFAVMNLYKRKKKANGELFVMYLVFYGIGRFFIEGLRTDQLFLWGTNIAVSQVVSIVLVMVGLIIFKYIRKNQKLVS